MSTVNEFLELLTKMNTLLREKLKSAPTSDQMEECMGKFADESNLGSSPFMNLIENGSIIVGPGSSASNDEKLSVFKQLNKDERAAIYLFHESRCLIGEGHSDYRPSNHNETMENAWKFQELMKENTN